jgi:hypothetical protein
MTGYHTRWARPENPPTIPSASRSARPFRSSQDITPSEYRQLEFDARAHDDGALAGKAEVFGGVGGDP